MSASVKRFIVCCAGILPLLSAGCSSGGVGAAAPDQPFSAPVGDEYTFASVEYRKWQNGTFQAWTTESSSETRTINGMNRYTQGSEPSRTAWGGRTDRQPTATAGKEGFFRTGTLGGRMYLIDPDGGAVILHGVQHVRQGESSAQQAAFASRFGNAAAWSKETGSLLADNHINYVSYGSKRTEAFPSDVRANLLTPKSQKVAYAETLYLLRTFMWDMTETLGYAFDDDKYNRLVLLFEPTFAGYIDALVQEKAALFAGDKHFIGYYLDNELPFASYQNQYELQGVDLKHFLALPDRYRAAREYAERFMQDKGIASVSDIDAQAEEDFRAQVADYYYSLTTETVRRHDAEHLILGSRLHDWSKYNEGVVRACARYCDVVSVNYYARWQPEDSFLADLKAWCGERPFLVSEFYTKAADALYAGEPYANTEGGGWLVRSQKNRGEFYQNFCLRLLEAKNCVGWVHFEYNDSFSSTSGASNRGMVSLEYEPYTDFLSYVRQLNLAVYSLADYYDK